MVHTPSDTARHTLIHATPHCRLRAQPAHGSDGLNHIFPFINSFPFSSDLQWKTQYFSEPALFVGWRWQLLYVSYPTIHVRILDRYW